MGVSSAIFAGVAALVAPPAQSFLFPVSNRLSLSPQTTLIPNARHLSVPTSPKRGGVVESVAASAAAAAAARPDGRFRCPPAGAGGGSRASDARRRSAVSVAVAMSAAEGEAGGAGPSSEGGADATQPQGEGSADTPVPDRRPAEPVGAAGAMEDDMLVELVGQDYGMMALLRNDKFRGLIVLLRNIPPNEWVAEVARAYPGDDEIKGMLGQVGKLMRMIDYYQAKKPNK